MRLPTEPSQRDHARWRNPFNGATHRASPAALQMEAVEAGRPVQRGGSSCSATAPVEAWVGRKGTSPFHYRLRRSSGSFGWEWKGPSPRFHPVLWRPRDAIDRLLHRIAQALGIVISLCLGCAQRPKSFTCMACIGSTYGFRKRMDSRRTGLFSRMAPCSVISSRAPRLDRTRRRCCQNSRGQVSVGDQAGVQPRRGQVGGSDADLSVVDDGPKERPSTVHLAQDIQRGGLVGAGAQGSAKSIPARQIGARLVPAKDPGDGTQRIEAGPALALGGPRAATQSPDLLNGRSFHEVVQEAVGFVYERAVRAICPRG